MKFLDEYRDAAAVRKLADAVARTVTRPWRIMEVCGGQTHAIVKHGLDQLLPPQIELLHGPGCPVCVTPLETIDRAHAIAARPEVIFCSFGDMLRVPGSRGDLLALKAQGADIRVVYSPLDAVQLAEKFPGREVVFFAVGFETTAPGNAMAVWQARRRGLKNFTVLVSHVTVPAVLEAMLRAPDNRVQGFLGPGHVCSIRGFAEYEPIAREFHVPIVIAGFEPVDLLEAILMLVRQLESGRAEVENQYTRVVRRDGNTASQNLVAEVFKPCDRKWRGIGSIARSGFGLRAEFAAFDAEKKFAVGEIQTNESAECLSGEILKGMRKPVDCPAFGTRCTPQHPLGATMVSNEGTCAAYFNYGRPAEVRR